ncbi:hypothetical protein R6G69_03425 [Actinotignum urinale]|uniref:hypothetical protein n=1 Tax=Actinotignum urinale TaxID=190146 RepID=UPI002A835D96|nr:hypothetical protein [Actinotignum urinale]MDY5129044.1 hypothetical protein [Actinotignum urinale]
MQTAFTTSTNNTDYLRSRQRFSVVVSDNTDDDGNRSSPHNNISETHRTRWGKGRHIRRRQKYPHPTALPPQKRWDTLNRV